MILSLLEIFFVNCLILFLNLWRFFLLPVFLWNVFSAVFISLPSQISWETPFRRILFCNVFIPDYTCPLISETVSLSLGCFSVLSVFFRIQFPLLIFFPPQSFPLWVCNFPFWYAALMLQLQVWRITVKHCKQTCIMSTYARSCKDLNADNLHIQSTNQIFLHLHTKETPASVLILLCRPLIQQIHSLISCHNLKSRLLKSVLTRDISRRTHKGFHVLPSEMSCWTGLVSIVYKQK